MNAAPAGARRALDQTLLLYSRRGRGLLGASALLSLVLLGLAVLALAISPPDEPLLQVAASALLFPFASVVVHRYKRAAERLHLTVISREQFPEVHQIVEGLCREAGVQGTPAVFLSRDPAVDPCTSSPGLRPYLVLGSDFLAGCRENDTPEALRFMLAHQVGHLALHHHTRRWLWLSTAILGTPVLRTIFLRHLELHADLWAVRAAPEGADGALALCAVGKDNFPNVRRGEQMRHWRHQRAALSQAARWTGEQVPAAERITRLDRWLPAPGTEARRS